MHNNVVLGLSDAFLNLMKYILLENIFLLDVHSTY